MDIGIKLEPSNKKVVASYVAKQPSLTPFSYACHL